MTPLKLRADELAIAERYCVLDRREFVEDSIKAMMIVITIVSCVRWPWLLGIRDCAITVRNLFTRRAVGSSEFGIPSRWVAHKTGQRKEKQQGRAP